MIQIIHSIIKNAVSISVNILLDILRVSNIVSFLKPVQFIKNTHGQRVVNYDGVTKAMI